MLSRIPAKRAAQQETHDDYRRREWLGATREGWPSVTAQAEDTIPASWLDKLLTRWNKARADDNGAANREHLARCKAILAAHRAGVPPDANDARICQEAHEMARDMARRLDAFKRTAEAELSPPRVGAPADRERMVMLGLFLEAVHWVELRGLELATRRVYIPGVLARLRCERWWRRVLRGLHARAVETTARAIGLVHKRAGCYISDESLKRRQGQRLRNDRALESVVAVNEHGQDYTLAELAAKGPANRQIRRMELMTRIAGFELIAKECGHEAYFVTVTCPSRMHAWRTKPGVAWEVEENPRHDKTTVEEAHAYLCRQWRAFSEACRRAGVELYGFRIAEPNHDGTPHWHVLMFFPRDVERGTLKHNPRAGLPVAGRVVVRMLRRYFLWNSDGRERGAKKHRVTVERIDWARGSAAGYVAKYVSKNIDGYRVEKDLYGNDALTSSLRVDAWASTHHIRQFQQIGGAPVGVWRELRRLHPDQAQQAEVIAYALDAVNVTAGADRAEDEAHDLEEGRTTAAHGWAAYLHVQGGHRVPRRALRLGVLREQTGELGRYGELMPPKAVGVQAIEARQLRMEMATIGVARIPRRVRVEVESERSTWLVVPKGNVAGAAERLRQAQPGREAARPWSPVNNCTPAPLFGPSVERHAKRGRWHRWVKKGPGGSTERPSDHGTPDRRPPGPDRTDRRHAAG